MNEHRRHVPGDEGGSAIVMVLMVSMLLMGALVVALTASDFAGSLSTHYGTTSQASLAAQSGLAVELSAMRNASVFTSLPCGAFSGSLTAPGAASSYSGTVTYYPSGTNPSALTCSGGSTLGGVTAPAHSRRSCRRAPPLTARRRPCTRPIAIATTCTPAQALGYALFTTNALDLTGAATLTNSGAYVANVYSGGQLTCGNGDIMPGAVTTYGAVNFTGCCTIAGLTASGAVTLGNSATVNGNLTSYAGPLAMSGSTKVTGTATETSGTSVVGLGEDRGQHLGVGGHLHRRGDQHRPRHQDPMTVSLFQPDHAGRGELPGAQPERRHLAGSGVERGPGARRRNVRLVLQEQQQRGGRPVPDRHHHARYGRPSTTPPRARRRTPEPRPSVSTPTPFSRCKASQPRTPTPIRRRRRRSTTSRFWRAPVSPAALPPWTSPSRTRRALPRAWSSSCTRQARSRTPTLRR